MDVAGGHNKLARQFDTKGVGRAVEGSAVLILAWAGQVVKTNVLKELLCHNEN